jgi:uncharacterized protein YeeX (DUF496 family)
MQRNSRGKWLVLVLIAIASAAYAQPARNPSQPNAQLDEWFMSRADNERGLQVRIKGKVEFTPDYQDVAALSRNGFVRLRETRGTELRHIEIETDKDGGVRRSFFVNDIEKSFDRDAGQWLAEVMRETVRQGGYDAERRVAHLFKQGGANAVLDVIPLLKDDFGKRVYFEQLLKDHPIEAAQVPRVIRQVARDIGSSYEKRLALNAVPRRFLNDNAVISELIAAAGTLKSDYECSQMLNAFAASESLNGEQLSGILQLVGTLAVPYDKAEALISLHKGHADAVRDLPGFYQAANGVGSAFEQSRVLMAVMNDRRLNMTALGLVIDSAAQMRSDYEIAGVLLRAAEVGKGDQEIQLRLKAATQSIRYEYERGRVLTAALR